MQPDRNASSSIRSGTAFSALTHIIVLAALIGIMHRAPKLTAYKFPGTKQGVELLTYYAPGSAAMAQNDIPVKAVAKPKAASTVHAPAADAKPDDASAPSTERGADNSGQSGLGDGDITIALQKYFPYPKPSLSTLPHGTAGDVILTAVIDEHGKISGLTLLQGLGPAIDNEVIQTVNQWTYTPATKNGVPVASVQELHFHYERNG
jgi:protein TonB